MNHHYPLGMALAAVVLVGSVWAAEKTRAERLRELFLSGDTNYVFVASHRMDWRNHPENSLSGAKSAIEMGVDILEIDPAITLDERFVLLHDAKLDRTTDGTGMAWDWTQAEICRHRLKANQGGANAPLTEESVATLEEVLLAAKDKCLVNIDKFAGQSAELLATVKRLGMERQVICKAAGQPSQIRCWTGSAWQAIDDGRVLYMPIVSVSRETDGVDCVLGAWLREKPRPRAYEVCLKKADGGKFFEEFRRLPDSPRLWMNAMWGALNNGHTRETEEYGWETGWDWFLDKGVTIIQTDRPAALLEYLNRKGRHALPEERAPVRALEEERPRSYWEGHRKHIRLEDGEVWRGVGKAFPIGQTFDKTSPSFYFSPIEAGRTNAALSRLESSSGRVIRCESPMTVWLNCGRWDLIAHGEYPILVETNRASARASIKGVKH